MSRFRRILVGWDGSRDARGALRAAVRLGEETGGEVVVLAVLQRHLQGEGADESAEEIAGRRSEVVAEMTAETHRRDPEGVRLRHEVIEADRPALALDAYAREHGFDLVVLGRHGVDRAVRTRIGGLTEYEVRHSACPVMVVAGD